LLVFPLPLPLLPSSVDHPLSRSCSRGGGGCGSAVLGEAAEGGRERASPGVRGVEVEDEVEGVGGVV